MSADIIKQAAEGLVSHPYFPRDLVMPHYIPNTMTVGDVFVVLAVVFGSSLAFIIVCAFLARKVSTTSKLMAVWMFFTANVHLIIEGYFAVFHRNMAADMSTMGQLWKEYSISDSRYVISDPFIVSMEMITAFFDGPVALMAAYGLLRRRYWADLAVVVVSICQLYGVICYFGMEILENFPHSDPTPYYFWFYFFFFNIVWVIIPTICAFVSGRRILAALRLAHRPANSKKTD
ncbi:hypothetical protein H696_00666 [Fonticula alba]|uniref:EXPERA domain-containing protein n=1 Tax=Fonticula alba TaxID=691883 RepID=A0A058ZHY0_FONAL|nr:hypothetical protein H696_00666 [Fonticula alba]KCV73122.1 hypothetical protein H696_00666 [Fonticula alba]|eukprot:XP_009492823.1 hypothetical protein H696_00666 [Fonticula alba]